MQSAQNNHKRKELRRVASDSCGRCTCLIPTPPTSLSSSSPWPSSPWPLTTITIAITWRVCENLVFVAFFTLSSFDKEKNIINISGRTCIPAVSVILISIIRIILITRRTCVPLQWAAQPIPWGEGLSDNSLQWDSNSFSFFILIPFHIPLFSSSDYLFIFSSPLLLQVSWPASLEICLSCLIPRPIKLWWGLRRKRNNSIFKSVSISL